MNTFRDIVCQRSGIAPEAFAAWVFRRSVYRHVVPFAWLIEKLNRDFFYPDYELVRRVGQAVDLKRARVEIDSFRGNPANLGTLRNLCKLRISSRRLYLLTQEYLSRTDTTPPFMESRPPM